jgi:glycosyltransferase involved in cell wall biosynthesis
VISVIIPTFGRHIRVEKAIASIQQQSGLQRNALEILVVDDGSPSPIVPGKADTRIRLVRIDANGGPAAARNAGIRASSGEYLAFLDSDDCWLPDKLSTQLNFLRSLEASHDRSRLAVVCGFYYPRWPRGPLEARLPRPATKLSDFVGGCWSAPGSTLLAHRSVFDRIGLQDSRLRRLEDYEWFLRFAAEGGRLHVSPYMGAVIAPSYAASVSSVVDAAEVIKHGNCKNSRLSRHDQTRLSAYLDLEIAVACLRAGKHAPGLAYLAQSLLRRPRLRSALDKNWKRAEEVPIEVLATYDDMLSGNWRVRGSGDVCPVYAGTPVMAAGGSSG